LASSSVRAVLAGEMPRNALNPGATGSHLSGD
jgi:hypothetical protein